MRIGHRKESVGVAERTNGRLAHSDTSASGSRKQRNNVRKIRESLLLSKAELARTAGVSALTIDRVEAGYQCRLETKRKIILALGMQISDRTKVFGKAEGPED
jgi:DNA-binding XRE family transcriptional regulator